MSARDLRWFLGELEKAGELQRVRATVSPRLEITEICQRVVREGGPALLFESVEGSAFPLAIHLFGSARRIEIACGRPPASIGEELSRLARSLETPTLRNLLLAAPRLRGLEPRVRSGGPVREIREEPDLDRLPLLTCWPRDAGPFLTFPLVLTRSPAGGVTNCGIYRMQKFGAAETGMHWQIAKGGGYHHREAEERGEPLPVAVALGGDPLLMLAGMMPLPEQLSELGFVGLLRGSGTELSRGHAIPVAAPARAEFVLEGEVAPGERREEGPFGDHFGHYSAVAPSPVLRLRVITRRRDAIYPAIVVGKPRQEDGFMGIAVQEMLGPVLRLLHPEVRSLWGYEETGFHHLLVASVTERFAKEAKRTAFALLGEGQLGLAKVLVTVGADVDPRDLDAVLAALAQHFDPSEDFLLLPEVPADTLDFTTRTLSIGSKMILDATPTRFGEGPPGQETAVRASARAGVTAVPDLVGLDRRIRGQTLLGGAILILQVDREPREVLASALAMLAETDRELGRDGAAAPPPIVAAVSPDVPLDTRTLLLWGLFTRFDPARDVFFARSCMRGACPVHAGRMAIDATWKPGYPEPLEMDPEVVRKVDRRWDEYGIKL